MLFAADASSGHGIVLSSEHDRYQWTSIGQAVSVCKPGVASVAIQAASEALRLT